jgi:hypothetical protein
MGGKKYTQVTVTDSDIAKAFQSDSAKCVVASALARTLPEITRIEVDTQTIRYTDGAGLRHVFLTPYAVHGYIIAFDAGDDIEPFVFRLWHEREVVTKRQVATDAGKLRRAASEKVRREGKALAKAEAKAKTPALPKVERDLARAEAAVRREAVTEAQVAQQDAVEATADETLYTTTEGERARPKRVRAYKTRTREYGHRVMRVNQVESKSS